MTTATTKITDPIAVMKRYEFKYHLDPVQTEFFKRRLQGKMEVDQFGLTSIASVYYDTPDYRLVRTSMEKPLFKEKMRLRSYGLASETSPVFLELKRKAYGIVYKRRIQTTVDQVNSFFSGDSNILGDSQIDREIIAFRDHYPQLRPSCLIIYDRTAYFQPDGDLRLTIDANPRYRKDNLNLTTSMEGTPLLPKGWSILEVKVQDAMPYGWPKFFPSAKSTRAAFQNTAKPTARSWQR